MLLQRRHFLRLMASAIAAPAPVTGRSSSGLSIAAGAACRGVSCRRSGRYRCPRHCPMVGRAIGSAFRRRQPARRERKQRNQIGRQGGTRWLYASHLWPGEHDQYRPSLKVSISILTRDIVPVASLWRVPLVIEVHPSVPVRTIPEFDRLRESQSRKAQGGVCGSRHARSTWAIELFKMLASVDLTLVPYLGSTPCARRPDGRQHRRHVRSDAIVDTHIKSGKLDPASGHYPNRGQKLCRMSQPRPILWLATRQDRGSVSAHRRERPATSIEKLNMEVNAALGNASIRARLSELGASVLPGSPTQFRRFITGGN